MELYFSFFHLLFNISTNKTFVQSRTIQLICFWPLTITNKNKLYSFIIKLHPMDTMNMSTSISNRPKYTKMRNNWVSSTPCMITGFWIYTLCRILIKNMDFKCNNFSPKNLGIPFSFIVLIIISKIIQFFFSTKPFCYGV